jgi:hypothetical protein
MEKKNKHVRVGFSTILWAVLAIVLCAAPCGALTGPQTVNLGDTLNLGNDYAPDNVGVDNGSVDVYGTLNMYPGAYVDWYVIAINGSTVNIEGGTVGMWIDVAPDAEVIVYGTYFEVGGVQHYAGEEMVITLSDGPLTVVYEDNTQVDLTFDCQTGATVTLAAPGGEPLLEAQLWVFPSLINRYGPLSKILAMVRLPEGISKNDIDSSRPLVLYANGYDDVKIEASCQRIIQWRRNGIVHTTIFASFDKAELIEAVPKGKVELEVVGGLNTGQDFYGIDTVRIVSWSWRRRWCR